MSETDPKLNPEEIAFQAVQKEYFQISAAAGETQYVIHVKRKELAKLNLRMRKLNKKADGMLKAAQAREAAKKQAPDLKIVPEQPKEVLSDAVSVS